MGTKKDMKDERHVVCPICNQDGVIMWKETKTFAKGKMYTYRKLYVYHNKTRGQIWHYISKEHMNLPQIKRAIESLSAKETTQNDNELHKTKTPVLA